jgi:predicted nucleic acid-binding Zn ribbon protein
MKQEFTNLSDLVKAGLKRVGLQGSVKEKTAKVFWAEIVGEKTASVTIVDNVRDGVLYVTCRDSIWAQQLHFLRPVLIEKLNERLGKGVIKEIRLSGVGFRKGQKREDAEEQPEKSEVKVTLTEEEVEGIAKIAEIVEDPGMAERVARGLKASLILAKKKSKQ